MQKTDEGSVQISEEVMGRLRKDKNRKEPKDNEEENQKIRIKEDDLKHLLKDAFEKGRHIGETEAKKHIESSIENDLSSERTKIKDLENSKNTNIDNLEKKIVDIQMSMKLQLTQKDKLLDATEERLSELKREKEEYQNKLDSRKESLNVEFDRGVEEIQKVIRPLQNKVTLCEQLQQDVIDCYKLNRHHPLRCSKIVDEFRQCVDNERLKQMNSDGS